MKELIVEKKYNGKKLNTFLFDHFDGLTFACFCKTLRKKDIRINDVRVSENVILHTNDNVKIYLSDDFLYSKCKIDIIYEDENICVLNKPSGIEVTGENSLTEQLQNYYNNLPLTLNTTTLNSRTINCSLCSIAPCHRLDRNTSGLLLFAKNENALEILLKKFKNREIEKIYRAKVYGIPKEKEHLLHSYLFKDNKKSLVYISDIPKKGYVKISTYYKVLEINQNENTSILEVNLLTGKTHQIRAHLAHIGLPIIGDR